MNTVNCILIAEQQQCNLIFFFQNRAGLDVCHQHIFKEAFLNRRALTFHLHNSVHYAFVLKVANSLYTKTIVTLTMLLKNRCVPLRESQKKQ